MTQRMPSERPMNAGVRGTQAPMVAAVAGKVRENDDVVTLKLAAEHSDTANFEPGQFNMLYVPGVGEAAISISDLADKKGRIIHTVRNAGATSRALTRLKKGDRLGLRGPFGAGWPVKRAKGRNVIVMAGGIGLAPLRPLIRHFLSARADYGSITLLYGARTPDAILFERDLRRWAEDTSIGVRITVDAAGPDWTGNVGLITSLLDRGPIDHGDAIAFICGPEIMMRCCADALCDAGLRRDAVWLSMERNMKCAVGHCGHCQFGPAFVCKDGPVFRYDRIRSNLFVKEL